MIIEKIIESRKKLARNSFLIIIPEKAIEDLNRKNSLIILIKYNNKVIGESILEQNLFGLKRKGTYVIQGFRGLNLGLYLKCIAAGILNSGEIIINDVNSNNIKQLKIEKKFKKVINKTNGFKFNRDRYTGNFVLEKI